MRAMIPAAAALAFFSIFSYAQEPGGRRGRLLKAWREKRQAEERLEAQAVGVTRKLNVPYSGDKSPAHELDIYSPGGKGLTVLVHFHGGGWKFGDKRMMKATGLFYASRGVLFVAPNYRLSPGVRHPAHVEDCAAALAWVFGHLSEWGGDRGRVFVSGHSAGAHLAALLGTAPAYLGKHGLKPSDLAGVIADDTASFDLLSGDNEGLVKRFVEEAFGSDEKTLKEASPFSHAAGAGAYPKFLVLNTTNREAAVRGGKAFVEKLKGAGGDALFVPVAGHTHAEMASGMFDAADPVGSAILKFMGKNKE
jgi:acetyl esterase/lipase